MATLRDLIQSTAGLPRYQFNPHNPISIKKVVPVVFSNAFLCQSKLITPRPIEGSKATEKPEPYMCLIAFHGLNFQMKHDAKHPFEIENARNKNDLCYMEMPRIDSTHVRVTCTCPDYFWRWSYHNHEKQVLAGVTFPSPEDAGYGDRADAPWGGYYGGPKVRRPDGTWSRGPVNPNKVMGICKHIHGFAEVLVDKGYLKK